MAVGLQRVPGDKELGRYSGSVDIVVVRASRLQRWTKLWWAGFIALSYIMMGATTFIVLFYCKVMILKKTTNLFDCLHVLLCTFGFQMLIPSGILLFSKINGPSVNMSLRQKKINHIVCQTSGLACGLFGAASVLYFAKKSFIFTTTVHCISGSLTCIFGVVAALLRICIGTHSKIGIVFRVLHRNTGSWCFVISSVSFISGLLKPSFKLWLKDTDILYLLIAYCVLYTTFIFSVPFIKCMTGTAAK